MATMANYLVFDNFLCSQLECVGSVDSGITGMQWSPDLELLILTTGIIIWASSRLSKTQTSLLIHRD